MLNKRLAFVILLLCLFVLGVQNLYAEEMLERFSLEISPEVSHYAYEEPGVMKNSGLMYGINTSYTYRDNLMLRIEGHYAGGHVDYESEGSGKMSNQKNYYAEVRGLAGYDFYLSKSLVFNPYLGYGYRYLNNDSGNKQSTTGAWGYERKSNYYYSPIGVNLIAGVAKDWRLTLNAEYDYFWYGRQISYLSDVYWGYNDMHNIQKHGYGVRGSIGIEKKTDTWGFAVEPFIRYWNIKNSERVDWTLYGIVIGSGIEPKNNTTEYGLKLTLNFW